MHHMQLCFFYLQADVFPHHAAVDGHSGCGIHYVALFSTVSS